MYPGSDIVTKFFKRSVESCGQERGSTYSEKKKNTFYMGNIIAIGGVTMQSSCRIDEEEKSNLIRKLRNEAKNKQSDKLRALSCEEREPLVSDILKGINLSFQPFIDARNRYQQRISDQKNAYVLAVQKVEREKEQIRIREETQRREKEFRRAEEQRLEEERRREKERRRAEEQRLAEEQRRRKTRKTVIAISCTAAVIGFLIVLFTSIIPSNRYKKAQQLYEAGSYGEAYKIFMSLGNFNDSYDLAEEVQPEAYREAINDYNGGKFQEAEDIFSELGDYQNSERYLKFLSSLKKYQKAPIGDEVKYGVAYNNLSQLSWIVLDRKDGKELLFLKESIEENEFHDWWSLQEPAWEMSTIRKWLNEEFLYNSFTNTERKEIQITTVRNFPNAQYGTTGGSDTEDYVFLLSSDEVSKYLSDKTLLKDQGSWWLRTKGKDEGYAMVVNEYGTIDYKGAKISDLCGVRPAIWIKIDGYEVYEEDMALLNNAS